MSANVLPGPASRKCEMCDGTGGSVSATGDAVYDYFNTRCSVCAGTGREPETCSRWGFGEDRCLKPYEHLGPCQDSSGNTTTSLASSLLQSSGAVSQAAEGVREAARAASALATSVMAGVSSDRQELREALAMALAMIAHEAAMVHDDSAPSVVQQAIKRFSLEREYNAAMRKLS